LLAFCKVEGLSLFLNWFGGLSLLGLLGSLNNSLSHRLSLLGRLSLDHLNSLASLLLPALEISLFADLVASSLCLIEILIPTNSG
jgi:hypothetical protein